jgi:phenylacetate-coenzyme A ligase PaaK-like adenylate-forming protein
MPKERSARARAAQEQFLDTPIERVLDEHARADPLSSLIDLVRETAASVPAYRTLLEEHRIDPQGVRSADDFRALPLVTKASYIARFPLEERCRDGSLSSCDMIAVSSGSTGEPTFWPRFVSDEFASATRFEQVFHDSFDARRRRTLAVVCFPLGTWVGGMFTASCCRHLAAKGYPITVVTPGNNTTEILRVVRFLAPAFEQTVLLGYPPFLKDVVDAGLAQGIAWSACAIKLVLAGEVFSEQWRDLMAERAGMTRPLYDSASLYGTADAGVLGNETPVSIAVRRFLSAHPDAAHGLFGQARLPTLVQYDPFVRYFEQHGRSLAFSGDNGVPLVRYDISDTGGVVPYEVMMARMRELGFDPEREVRRQGNAAIRSLPFVYVFGRSHFAVSYYGANIFPEMIAIALERPETRNWVTGKFVMEVKEDDGHDPHLFIAVELAAGREPPATLAAIVADAMLETLVQRNSEFANYVPPQRRRPRVTLWPAGHAEYFPTGVKHRYAR